MNNTANNEIIDNLQALDLIVEFCSQHPELRLGQALAVLGVLPPDAYNWALTGKRVISRIAKWAKKNDEKFLDYITEHTREY